ncbi:hypothetical protein [uncultured Arthrobacter sp.]|uniref:hypothetical protein n=1 Tax=uncultured Arthrobacter sp. TaxID=114050 RepID=UPI0032167022
MGDPQTSVPGESSAVTVWNFAHGWDTIQDEDRTKHPTQEIMREVFQPGQELQPLIPPLRTTEYDWDGLNREAFNSWDGRLSPVVPTDEERKNLLDLILAWESGLDTVIVLPYGGYFAKCITRRQLAVSVATRDEPATYRRALREADL